MSTSTLTNTQKNRNIFKLNVIKLAFSIWITIMLILVTSYAILNHYIKPLPVNIIQIKTPQLETDNTIQLSNLSIDSDATIHILSNE